jgi:hypothetical protein
MYGTNSVEILRLNSELNSLVDAKVLAKVKTMKLFSCLNSEKPISLF